MYSVIDIESNGAGFREECIIELAIFVYDGHEVVDQLITLINPEAEITQYVQKLTGITPKMVKRAPKFHEIAKRVIEMTENTTLVGHNVEFDYRMLRQSFRRLGFDFKINTIDTLPLAKKLIPDVESYSLGKLCKSVGIPLSDAHRAGGDARATLDLFKLLISKDTENQIIQQHQEETQSKLYINKINELTENLPSEKGIFYLQDKAGKIIFCDFSDNIYKSAKGILNSKSKRNIQFQKNVEQIYYEFTGTDIIALLMLKEKKVKRNTSKPFAVRYSAQTGSFFVSSSKKNEGETDLFNFKYPSQAEKLLSILQKENLDYKALKKKISFAGRNELWVGQGRKLGEHSFLAFKGGKFIGYGFYELYHQTLSWEKILKLTIPVTTLPKEIKNEMQIAYLKGEFKVIKINS